MRNTSIEWTDATWNPVRGCSRISPGCKNCYAERVAARFSDPGAPFHLFAERMPSPHWTGKTGLVEKHINDPLHWKQPRRIFVNSMSDLFHEGIPFEVIDQVFTVMVAANLHTYQILTKRADRMFEYFRSGRHDNGHGPDRANYHLDQNIWLGVSVENQEYADARIPLLLQTPAAIRFVSYEPALGPVDFRNLCGNTVNALDGIDFDIISGPQIAALNQIIVGGESGPGARPFHLEWMRSTVQQGAASRVAIFCKQIGSNPYWNGYPLGRADRHDKKGGDMEFWPHDLRVRQYPQVRV